MRTIFKINLYILLALVSGCIAMGEKFQPVTSVDGDMALIYLYHPKDDQYGSEEANFLFYNDEKIFRFTHNGYTYFNVPAGEHHFSIKLSTFFVATDLIRDSLTINAESGKTYYIRYVEKFDRIETYSTGTMMGAYRLTYAVMNQVPSEEGQSEIENMKLIKNKYID